MNEKQIIESLNECEALWSKYSCDCLAFEIAALQSKLKSLKP